MAPGGIEPPRAGSKPAALSTELRGRRRVSMPQSLALSCPREVAVAQLVELRVVVPVVAGSSPVRHLLFCLRKMASAERMPVARRPLKGRFAPWARSVGGAVPAGSLSVALGSLCVETACACGRPLQQGILGCAMRVLGGAIRSVCLLALVVLSGLLWRGALDAPERAGRGVPAAGCGEPDRPVCDLPPRGETAQREAATQPVAAAGDPAPEGEGEAGTARACGAPPRPDRPRAARRPQPAPQTAKPAPATPSRGRSRHPSRRPDRAADSDSATRRRRSAASRLRLRALRRPPPPPPASASDSGPPSAASASATSATPASAIRPSTTPASDTAADSRAGQTAGARAHDTHAPAGAVRRIASRVGQGGREPRPQGSARPERGRRPRR